MATTDADAVFLDTNILVHANATASIHHQRALGALIRVEQGDGGVWISRQVLREYIAVVTRPQAYAAGLTSEQAVARARDFASRFSVAEDGPEVMERLLELVATRGVHGRKVHDANIVATMLAHGIGRLVTLDAADFRRYEPLIVVEEG
jgi:predicted nucleic acid-binding protein